MARGRLAPRFDRSEVLGWGEGLGEGLGEDLGEDLGEGLARGDSAVSVAGDALSAFDFPAFDFPAFDFPSFAPSDCDLRGFDEPAPACEGGRAAFGTLAGQLTISLG